MTQAQDVGEVGQETGLNLRAIRSYEQQRPRREFWRGKGGFRQRLRCFEEKSQGLGKLRDELSQFSTSVTRISGQF